MSKKIQITESSMPPMEEFIDQIKDLWDTKWLTNSGIKHQELEGELKKYLKVPNVSLFTNGHLALESIISAFDLTGEVITTPFTFSSTTQAIVRNGLKPVFCDINEEDFTIDVNKIEELITEKTSAIIPVHVYGNICDVKAIEKIASKYNLKVIYDAAHVFGVEYEGQGIGNYGDASIFSFHATKVFNTIEGGGVTYNDSNLTPTLNAIKNFGFTSQEEVEYIAGNAKMNEFQAAMGLANLNHVDANIKLRKLVYDRYVDNLRDIPGIKLVEIQKDVRSNFAYIPVLFSNYKYNRDEIVAKLFQKNIFARKYFYPLTSDFKVFKELNKEKNTPIAEEIANNIITLPLYPALELEDVDRICKIILD